MGGTFGTCRNGHHGPAGRGIPWQQHDLLGVKVPRLGSRDDGRGGWVRILRRPAATRWFCASWFTSAKLISRPHLRFIMPTPREGFKCGARQASRGLGRNDKLGRES